MSANLKDFEATGVQYLEMTPSPELSDISKDSEVGIDQPDYYRELIDAARGASGQTKDQIFEQLNSKWATGVASAGLRKPPGGAPPRAARHPHLRPTGSTEESP